MNTLYERMDADLFALLGSRATDEKTYQAAIDIVRTKYQDEMNKSSFSHLGSMGTLANACKKYKPDKQGRNKVALLPTLPPVSSSVELSSGNGRKHQNINFAALIRHMIEETNELPSVSWLEQLALFFGYAPGNVSANISNLRDVYLFAPGKIDGLIVTHKVDPIDKVIEDLQAQIDELKRRTRSGQSVK